MRRAGLLAVSSICIAALLVAAFARHAAATPKANPIVVENRHAGTTSWQLSHPATDQGGQIKGYASATSVNKGGSITFYVTVAPAQTYAIDVFRLGWYGGKGGRLLRHVGSVQGAPQPTCPIDPATGMIACSWKPSYTLRTSTSWTSGIYLAKLTNAQGFDNYIIFVVRDDARRAPLLYQLPVNTYEAYNGYPDSGPTDGVHSHNCYAAGKLTNATKVSFDRPYDGSGSGSAHFLTYEINFLRWLERSGYNVSYSTDIDTHAHGSRLLRYRGFLAVGHDEYWTREMYDAAVAARDHGVNLAFFTANPIYWQIRLEPSARGVPNRIIDCYKDANLDPDSDPALKTVKWRDPPVNRPEQTLVGVPYTSLFPAGVYAPYVVTNGNNWVYAGTGFHDGDSVPGIVGYEADKSFGNYPAPPARPGTYTLLSHSPFTDGSGRPDYANSSVYQAASGAWVFAAGTFAWGWALDSFGGHTPDPRMRRATANILNRFSQAR
jgi:hypothetical protein